VFLTNEVLIGWITAMLIYFLARWYRESSTHL
jgi:hypothetical protein